MGTDFTLFPKLITELRLEIWRQALPNPIKKPLYPYRKGCWQPRQLKEGDAGFEPELPDYHNLELEFDSSRLDPLHIDLPMFLVNQEARDITLEYARRNRLARSSRYHFIRPFNSKTDTVFLSSDDVDDFLWEPMNRPHEPDLTERPFAISFPVLHRLATSPAGFKAVKDGLAEYFSNIGPIEVIYVVPSSDQASMQPQELEEQDFIRYVWSGSQRKWDIISNVEGMEAGSSLEDFVDGLNPDLESLPGGQDFEIRVAASAMHPKL